MIEAVSQKLHLKVKVITFEGIRESITSSILYLD